MKDVDLVCDMITVCRERLETDVQYQKPLCDLIKVCGLVYDIYPCLLLTKCEVVDGWISVKLHAGGIYHVL